MKAKYLLFLSVVVLCACLGLSCVSAADNNLTSDNVNTTDIDNSTSDDVNATDIDNSTSDVNASSVNLTSDNVNTTDIDNSTSDVNATSVNANITHINNSTENSVMNVTGDGKNKPFEEGYGHLQLIYGCMVAGAATGMVVGAYAGACVAGVPGAFILGMVGFSIGGLCGFIFGVVVVLIDIIFGPFL